MLTSMKVRNFLCFDYFKFNFIQDQSSILVIGENGVGKTLIGKILFIFNRYTFYILLNYLENNI